MEITTAEECHVVGLFPDAAAAGAAGAEVGAAAAGDDGYAPFFGEQHVLTRRRHGDGAETLALAMATPLAVNEAVALVHAHGGLAVAAHIDRPTFGVIAPARLLPRRGRLRRASSCRATCRPARERRPSSRATACRCVHSSDSHYLERRRRGAHRVRR